MSILWTDGKLGGTRGLAGSGLTSAAQPLLAEWVQGFGPQLVQETISLATGVESLFLSP